MNREETLALYEQGVEAWNDWANKMLKERKRLEESGEWEVDSINQPQNKSTTEWFNKSEIIFSKIHSLYFKRNKADFTDFIFPGNAIFSNFIFHGVIRFDGTIFKQEALFDGAVFEDVILFENTKFENSASFENAIFKDIVFIFGEVFTKDVSFKNAIFQKDATFKGNFIEDTSFEYASFKKEVEFNNCCFKKTANFGHSEFKEKSSFENNTFKKNANFSHTTFQKPLTFDTSIFKGEVFFDNGVFESSVRFNLVKFHDNAHFTSAIFKRFTNFEDAKFKKEANFGAIRSENAFSLKSTIFKTDVPDFIQAHFEESPRLDHIELDRKIQPGGFLRSILSPVKSDIKARYQALKRLAIQAHDHENEQLFWAGELRSDRSLRIEDNWNFRPLVSAFWWGNIAYGFFSNYGRSIVRPLASLIAFMFIMTSIHIYAHNCLNKEPSANSRTKTHITKQLDLKDCDIRSSAFRVAAKNGAIGLLQNPAKRSTFVRDYTCLYGTYNDNVTPKIPNSIFGIELFHTLFSAILIFLTLLGIRNNFKLK